nr:hypothetical protein GCM10020093_017440 [Planobispora longispora]
MADDLAGAFLRQHRRYTSRQVAAMTGIPMYRARRFWRAFGFADVADDAVEFTDSDVEALLTLIGLVRDGTYDEEHALLVTRSLGRATARLAESQAVIGVEALDQAGVPCGSARTPGARGPTGWCRTWSGCSSTPGGGSWPAPRGASWTRRPAPYGWPWASPTWSGSPG